MGRYVGNRKWEGSRAKIGLILVLALVLAACGGDGADPATTVAEGDPTTLAGGDEPSTSASASEGLEVTMMLSHPRSIAWMPLLVAEDQGYFEAEGIQVSTLETEGSGFVIQQLIAGNEDWGWAVAPSIVAAAAQEPDLRVVGCSFGRNTQLILAPAGGPVQDVTDLRDRKLGVTELGGGEAAMVDAVLKEHDMVDEVEILPIGDAGPASARAIRDGVVDAFAGSTTDTTTFETAGIEFINITPEKYGRMPGDCLVTTRSVLESEENQDIAARILRAWAKGTMFALEDTDSALDITCNLEPESCTDREGFARPLAERLITAFPPLDPSLPPTALDIEGWETTEEVLRTSGAIADTVDIQLLVNSPETQAVAALAYENVEQLQADAEEDANAYESSGG